MLMVEVGGGGPTTRHTTTKSDIRFAPPDNSVCTLTED